MEVLSDFEWFNPDHKNTKSNSIGVMHGCMVMLLKIVMTELENFKGDSL